MNPTPHYTTNYFSEDELREAACIVVEAMLNSLPKPEECHHDISPNFLAKMELLLAKAKRREIIHRWTKRVAAALLALVVGVTSWLAVDVEARATFFAWVREVYESSVVYRFFNDVPTINKLPDYRPSWVPDGYVQTNVIETDTIHSMIYQNSEDPTDGFVFDYNLYSDNIDSFLLVHQDGYEFQELNVNGKTAHYYRSLDGSRANDLIWIDETTTILFTLNGYLNLEVMLHIAESVELVN